MPGPPRRPSCAVPVAPRRGSPGAAAGPVWGAGGRCPGGGCSRRAPDRYRFLSFFAPLRRLVGVMEFRSVRGSKPSQKMVSLGMSFRSCVFPKISPNEMMS